MSELGLQSADSRRPWSRPLPGCATRAPEGVRRRPHRSTHAPLTHSTQGRPRHYGFDTGPEPTLPPHSFMSLRGTTISAGLSVHGHSVVASVIASISVAVVVTRAPQGGLTSLSMTRPLRCRRRGFFVSPPGAVTAGGGSPKTTTTQHDHECQNPAEPGLPDADVHATVEPVEGAAPPRLVTVR